MTRKSGSPVNSLVDSRPGGTISKCRSVLNYIANATFESVGPEIDYGQFLVLMCVCDALKQAEEAISEPALEVVNG